MPLTDAERQTLEDLAQSVATWHRTIGLKRFLSLVELAFQTGALTPDAAQHLQLGAVPYSTLVVCLKRRVAGDPRFSFAYLGNRAALITFMQLPLPPAPVGADVDPEALAETGSGPDVPAHGAVHALLLNNHKRFEFFAAFADLLTPFQNDLLAASFCQFHEPGLSRELAAAYESLGYLGAAVGGADDPRLAGIRRALDLVSTTLQSSSLSRLLLAAAVSGRAEVEPAGDKLNLLEFFAAVRFEVRVVASETPEAVAFEPYLDTPQRAQFLETDTGEFESEG